MSTTATTIPFLVGTTYTLGILNTLIGLISIIFPGISGQLLGLPTSPHSANFSTTATFIAAKGARDIALGFCFVVFAATQNVDGIKTMIAASVLVGAVDATLIWRYGSTERAWLLGIGTAVLAGYLLLGCMG
ncbi:hypothetical protein BP5796_07896 [Coleophoma crateriformis]|uniref:Uncharacterized protein n=1 Tax=Coleophoma crateriformis TaxID=565419 RepID=A0A3D8RCV1_9HELO|nr:hypothetical protein BP5796_07896 [Coleophoma crateriformis]